MKVTFADAKTQLQPFVGACYPDIATAVNTAIRELAKLRQWDDLKHLLRFTVSKDYFSLPQACGRLLRCCVEKTPVSIRSRDFQFLNSSLGEIPEDTSFGIPSQIGILSLGTFPVMCDPAIGQRLVAFSEESSEAITMKTMVDGVIRKSTIPVNESADPSLFETGASTEYSTAIAGDVVSIVLPGQLRKHIYLYSEDGSFISVMHPAIKVPEFMRYRLPGVSARGASGSVVSILTETLVNPLPLVDDDDVLPFGSLLPVQYMMQSLNAGTNNDIKGVANFQALAEGTLVRHEGTADKAQRPLTLINPVASAIGGRNRSGYWGEYP